MSGSLRFPAFYIDRGVFRMKNKISRRQFLQAAGASAAALLLASCSGNSASSVSSSSVASSAASSVAASSEAASSAAASSEATSTVTTTGKTLVVYFSVTGIVNVSLRFPRVRSTPERDALKYFKMI